MGGVVRLLIFILKITFMSRQTCWIIDYAIFINWSKKTYKEPKKWAILFFNKEGNKEFIDNVRWEPLLIHHEEKVAEIFYFSVSFVY